MTPEQYCNERVQRAGSSFYYSFLFLPKAKRLAMNALYAYCREVDDVVDECSDPVIAREKLTWWDSEIGRLFSGEPQHPVTQALLPVVKAYALPEEYFREILAGMRMDLDYNRYPDFKTLEVYCYRVAGVVGLLSAEIFGYSNLRTREFARQLGIALQLTNIIRDVREDADRNRIYLPLKDLEHFGASVEDLLLHKDSEAVRNLLQHQVARAKGHYDRAYMSLAEQDRRNQRASLVMGNIYYALLVEIERGGCKVLTERTQLTPLRKLWIAWKTWCVYR